MKGALCALLFLGVVGSTLAVECYSCNPLTSGDNCNDPFNSKGISKQSCSGQCMKTDTAGLVTRICTAVCVESCPDPDACVTCCDGDLCNGAGPVTFSLVAMFAMVASTWAFSQQ